MFFQRILIICLVALVPLNAEADLELQLQASQDTFVVGEPVKFVVMLLNNSERKLCFGGFDYFYRDLYYEITTPNGTSEIHDPTYTTTIDRGMWPIDCPRLCPNDYLQTYTYPNFSSLKSTPPELTRIFDNVGNYTVRAIYEDPIWLRKPLYSNRVQVTFIAPTIAENEIFSAYWSSADAMTKYSDEYGRSTFNENPLQTVISKYPREPMIKYAYYALLRTLEKLPISTEAPESTMAKFKPARLEEVLRISKQLRSEYPDFRYFEVRHYTAYKLWWAGRRSEAIQLYRECLSTFPQLIHDNIFVHTVFFVRDGDGKAFYDWIKKRAEGVLEEIEFTNR